MLPSLGGNKAHSQQKGRGSTAVVATESSPIKKKSFLTLGLRLSKLTFLQSRTAQVSKPLINKGCDYFLTKVFLKTVAEMNFLLLFRASDYQNYY